MKNEANNFTIDSVRMMVSDGVISQEQAEKYFPELKADRIKKSVICFLKQCDSVYQNGFSRFGINVEEAIAWLEEKKESPNLYGGDIEVLKEVISDYENGTFPFLKEDRIRMAERLKAIRPTKAWKPSKKQLDALEYYIKPILTGYGWEETAIGSLYMELKKM